jgi:predicted amidohydrolase YtcJ
LLAATSAHAQQTRADLVLLHGDLYTVDSTHPRAQAIAVRGDRIAAVLADGREG